MNRPVQTRATTKCPSHSLVFGIFCIALLGATTLIATNMLLPAWLLALFALAFLGFYVGKVAVGRKSGLLIDQRNAISLARFQLFLWIALILSAYLVSALFNIFSGLSVALHIRIPAQLWWLLGICAITAIAAALILDAKSRGNGNASVSAATLEILHGRGYEPGELESKGHVVVKKDAALAHWSDMLIGAEVGNAAHLDPAKVQLLVMTLVLAMAYAILLCSLFSGDALARGIQQLPGLHDSAVALFAISNAFFLAAKAIPRN